ncbi:hypothetical protein K1T71_006614 [Dendrolimus kikuchii]|uniref:Uncharacterized protein n=1 Tax=Dendrolimus kikuchii TaxID=765133 RepID=A0ACC1D1M4_9NEOP|nr:hypothetical protein K1T71_006614 [Dendrolimus kikuchii]
MEERVEPSPRSNDSGLQRKVKRIRSAFTTDQITYLEREFRKCPYINNIRRKDVAIALRLPERAIKIWFQNRRMKRKKDTNSTDHEQELVCLSPIENTKKQLNNGEMSLSANDQKACSLPILINTNSTGADIQVIENNKLSARNVITPINSDYYKESMYLQNQLPVTKNTPTTNTVLKDRPSINNFTATSELSIGLCKKYQNLSDKNIRDKDKKLSRQKVEESRKLKSHGNQVTNVSTDLTSHRKKDIPLEQKTAKKVTPNPEYIPVVPNFYPQPYVHPGGVMWNPINVMPLMSTGAAAVIPNGYSNIPVSQDNVVPRSNCTCDCHVKTYPVPVAFQQSPVGPQYIMTAVSLQNPSTKF